MYIVKTVWMETNDDVENLNKFIRDIIPELNKKCNEEVANRLKEFRNRKALSMIYTSNKMENTMPSGCCERNTYRILENILYGIESDAPEEKWFSDGGSASQLHQHVQAYKFLCEMHDNGEYLYQKPLSVEIILKAHELLMTNAVDEHGKSVPSGSFRTDPVHAGDYVYMHHDDVPSEVHRIVQNFNNDVAKRKDPIETAVNLFYDLITAHPFIDGNGRLCRLMATYAFFATGTPFPVFITSGHTKARNHYMRAILISRRLGNDRSQLYTLFAQSLELGWSNLATYCKL